LPVINPRTEGFMAGNETKESLHTKAQAHLEAVVGPKATATVHAVQEAFEKGDYKGTVGDLLKVAGQSALNGVTHPINTTIQMFEACGDDIRALVTPSAPSAADGPKAQQFDPKANRQR